MSHPMLFPALFPAAFPSLYHGTCSRLRLCCQPLDCEAVLERGCIVGGTHLFCSQNVLFLYCKILPDFRATASFQIQHFPCKYSRAVKVSIGIAFRAQGDATLSPWPCSGTRLPPCSQGTNRTAGCMGLRAGGHGRWVMARVSEWFLGHHVAREWGSGRDACGIRPGVLVCCWVCFV